MDQNKSSNAAESKLHFLDYWRIIRIRKTVILAVFLLVVLTTTIVSVLLKPTYASTARIAIEKDTADITPLLGVQPNGGQYDPYWIQTEFEKIQSKLVLHRVIKKLRLNEVWGERYNTGGPLTLQETYLALKKLIEVNQYRNTSIIEITAYSEDKKEAAAVANAIAEEYQTIRSEHQQDLSKRGIDVLRNQLKEQNQEVIKKQGEVDDLKQTLNIADVYTPEGTAQAATIGPQTVLRIEQERTAALADFTRYQALYSNLDALSPEEMRKAALTLMPNDLQLASLFNEYDKAIQLQGGQQAIYGPENGKMAEIKGVILALDQLIKHKLEGVLIGIKTEMASTRDRVAMLKKAVEEAKRNDVATTRSNRTYFLAKRELENLQKIRDMIFIRLLQETVDKQIPQTAMVEIYDQAEPELNPVRPKIPLNIALGVIVGLIVGVGLAFFIEYLDTSVKTIDDVEQALQAPVLGVIPQNVGAIIQEGPDSPHAEAYRVLRTNILFSRKSTDQTTITVVSGGAGEGKSTTIFNLATVFAQQNSRVLVVDSDLRRPSLHKQLGVSNALGLTNHLMGQNNLEEVIQTTKLPMMDFLPSGKLPSSSLGILNSPRMKQFVSEVKSRYDYVLFDSPPIMGVSDASVLASEVDLSLLVIQYRKYPQAMTIRAKQMVEKVGGNMLGVVLNNINISQDSYYYYYSGYYYDYYSKKDQEESKTQKKNGETQKPASSARGELELKKKY